MGSSRTSPESVTLMLGIWRIYEAEHREECVNAEEHLTTSTTAKPIEVNWNRRGHTRCMV